jgi:general secretion pathway protein D
MRSFLSLGIAVCLLTAAGPAAAQTAASASESASDAGVPLAHLLALVSKKSGKKFIVDPRARADVVLLGQDPASVSYSDLLTILGVYGFAGVEGGGYVRIVPDANVRYLAPLISGKETRPDAEWVAKVIPVHSVSAAQLVPILRPLIPQQGQLAALPCVNMLTIVDDVAGVKRIESLLQTLDVGPAFKPEPCTGPVAIVAPREGQPPPPPTR